MVFRGGLSVKSVNPEGFLLEAHGDSGTRGKSAQVSADSWPGKACKGMSFEVQKKNAEWQKWSEHQTLAAALESAFACRQTSQNSVRILEDGQELPDDVLKGRAQSLGLAWVPLK